MVHLHAEHEGASLHDSCRVNTQSSVELLHKLLANHKAQSDPLGVHLRSTLKLAEFSEKLLLLLLLDAKPSILHVNNYGILAEIIASTNFDAPRGCEFQRVFYQIDDNLL